MKPQQNPPLSSQKIPAAFYAAGIFIRNVFTLCRNHRRHFVQSIEHLASSGYFW